ncbi:MAG: hypothetical protein ABIN67_23600 [Ferruginibacter sp.]
MKQLLILAALSFSIASCNNQDRDADIPTGNSDSVGATGTNPGTGTIDTSMNNGSRYTDSTASTTGADSLR